MCDVEEQIVGEEAAEKGLFSDDLEDEDEADTGGDSDSSDVVDVGKLCKRWESILWAINWKGNYQFYTANIPQQM